MEERVEYGDRQGFNVEILSRGGYVDRVDDDLYQIDTYTLRLNHVALNGYLLSLTNNCRECYGDGRAGDEQWAAHQTGMAAQRKIWKAKMLEALRIGPGDGSVVIKQIQAEVFAAVRMREVDV